VPPEQHCSTYFHASRPPTSVDTSLPRTAPKRQTYPKKFHNWHGVPTRLHQPAPSPAASSAPNGRAATGDPPAKPSPPPCCATARRVEAERTQHVRKRLNPFEKAAHSLPTHGRGHLPLHPRRHRSSPHVPSQALVLFHGPYGRRRPLHTEQLHRKLGPALAQVPILKTGMGNFHERRTEKNGAPEGPFPGLQVKGSMPGSQRGGRFYVLFLLVHVVGALTKHPWDTSLASCGPRSPLRSVFLRGKVSVDVHRGVCQVARAVLIVIACRERGQFCSFSLRLETPVQGDGAFTPAWGGSVAVSFAYLVHGHGWCCGEGGR